MSKHGESHVTEGLAESEPVVRWFWPCQGGKLVRRLCPVEVPRVHDDASQRTALAREELRGAVHHDVSTEVNGPAEVGSGQGVVDDKRHLDTACNLCEPPQVTDHPSWVRQALSKKQFHLGLLHGLPNLCKVVHIHESALPVELLDGLAKLRDAATIQLVRGHYAIARLHKAEERDNLSSMARGGARGAPAALEVGYAFLQHRHSRVCEPTVDVSKGGEVEEGGSMVHILKHVRCVLEDRCHTCARGSIRCCPSMDGPRFEAAEHRLPLTRPHSVRLAHRPPPRRDDLRIEAMLPKLAKQP
mmetsp:Transcript_42537/g.98613  ORF Transcript_42537/g.98613 Transcript_42537/m.98613 type:complete len:301 (+) Transcript_42537:567-1469(+)